MTDWDGEASVGVLALGDLALQRPPARSDVIAELARAGEVFANLEIVLTRRSEAAEKLLCLRADPGLAATLAECGVGVVSLANNHAADFGLGGLEDTRSALAGARVASVGAGSDFAEATAPVVRDREGLRIAFLGFATTLPNGCAAGPTRPGIAPIRILSRFIVDPVTMEEAPGMAPFVETAPMPGDVDRACSAVRDAAAAADVVVVGIHWGVPDGWAARFQGELATYQRPLAHALVDAGADSIVGHHPHVVHAVELYRERPIFYSLGNFLFHALLEQDPEVARPAPSYQWSSLRGELNTYGAVAALRWGAGGGPPETVELWPLRLSRAGEPAFANNDDADAVIGRVRELSEPLGTTVERRSRQGRVVASFAGPAA